MAGKHLCWSLSFNKFVGLTSTLLKKRIHHRFFPVSFVKFLRTPFFTEHLRWLLLNTTFFALTWECWKFQQCQRFQQIQRCQSVAHSHKFGKASQFYEWQQILHGECSNTEFFLVRIGKIRTRENSVFLDFSSYQRYFQNFYFQNFTAVVKLRNLRNMCNFINAAIVFVLIYSILPISTKPILKAVFHSVKIFARADFWILKILRGKI